MTERRSRRAVAPYGEERRALAKVGPGSCPNATRREAVGCRGALRPGGPRTRRRGMDGWSGSRGGRRFRACRFTTSSERQESVHTAPHPEALQIDDPPTRAGFITALDDAYLMPRADGYAVFSRTSGRDLCAVRPEVAERALRREGQAVQLGTWSGTLRGRADDWTLWWARGVPWAATSDVAGGEEILPLIERWQNELARAQAHGRRWEPLPPGVALPARARGAARPARPRPRSRVLGGLRALFRAI